MRTLSPRYVSPQYAALQAELLEGIAIGEARVKLREVLAENPQVRPAVAADITTISKDHLSQVTDLVKCSGRKPRARQVLTEPARRAAKLSIETTRIHPVTGDVLPMPPLEPWTCPVRCGMLAYAEIMGASDGAFSLGDFTGDRLEALTWMRSEELISVGDDGRIHALSDGDAPKTRAYPGAPLRDPRSRTDQGKHAGRGDSLDERAAGLILAALFNLSQGRTVRRGRKRRAGQLVGANGLRITAAQVCTEANSIKAKRRDLAGFRYLSLSTCRRWIRGLIDMEVIEEIQPPKPSRQKRSWRTIPRVIRRMTTDLADLFGLKPPEAA